MQTTAIVKRQAVDDCGPEQVRAQRPTCAACPNPIEVIPGHRPRRYCSDTCKQRAYLEREMARQRDSRLAQLHAAYPDFSEATITLLDSFLAAGNEEMVDRLAATITGERAAAQRGQEQVQQRFSEYVTMTNARLSELSGELARRRQEQERTGKPLAQAERQELAQARADLTRLRQASRRDAEEIHQLTLALDEMRMKLRVANRRIEELEQDPARPRLMGEPTNTC